MEQDHLPSIAASAGARSWPVAPAMDDRVRAAVREAFDRAGVPLPGAQSSVTPLLHLVESYPVFVHEVPRLDRQTAAEHLAAHAGRPLLAGFDDHDDLGERQDLAGYLYANSFGGWILVRQDDPLPRRRFTVAHELGHYLLHFLPWQRALELRGDGDGAELAEEVPLPRDDADRDPGTGRSDLLGAVDGEVDPAASLHREDEADRFAAEVLMPATRCHQLADRLSPQCGDRRPVLARRLASEFLVSRWAMERRLRELGIASA